MAWDKVTVITSETDWVEASSVAGTWTGVPAYQGAIAIAGYAIAGIMIAGRSTTWE